VEVGVIGYADGKQVELKNYKYFLVLFLPADSISSI
jgi:hypothetical protein